MCNYGLTPPTGNNPIPIVPNNKKRLGIVIPWQLLNDAPEIIRKISTTTYDDVIDTIYLDVFANGQSLQDNSDFFPAIIAANEWLQLKDSKQYLHYQKKLIARVHCFNWGLTEPSEDWKIHTDTIKNPLSGDEEWWLNPYTTKSSTPGQPVASEAVCTHNLYSEILLHTKKTLNSLFQQYAEISFSGIHFVDVHVPYWASEKHWTANPGDYKQSLSCFIQSAARYTYQKGMTPSFDLLSDDIAGSALQDQILTDMGTHQSYEYTPIVPSGTLPSGLLSTFDSFMSYRSKERKVLPNIYLVHDGSMINRDRISAIYKALHHLDGSNIFLDPNLGWEKQLDTLFEQINKTHENIEFAFQTEGEKGISGVIVNIEDNHQNDIELPPTDSNGKTYFRVIKDETCTVKGIEEKSLKGVVTTSHITKQPS